jgi:hypothetical protein
VNRNPKLEDFVGKFKVVMKHYKIDEHIPKLKKLAVCRVAQKVDALSIHEMLIQMFKLLPVDWNQVSDEILQQVQPHLPSTVKLEVKCLVKATTGLMTVIQGQPSLESITSSLSNILSLFNTPPLLTASISGTGQIFTQIQKKNYVGAITAVVQWVSVWFLNEHSSSVVNSITSSVDKFSMITQAISNEEYDVVIQKAAEIIPESQRKPEITSVVKYANTVNFVIMCHTKPNISQMSSSLLRTLRSLEVSVNSDLENHVNDIVDIITSMNGSVDNVLARIFYSVTKDDNNKLLQTIKLKTNFSKFEEDFKNHFQGKDVFRVISCVSKYLHTPEIKATIGSHANSQS